jgi:PKD repeat protein
MIVDVVFSKWHFKDLTVRVDTSLFKGRPSKWGQLIDSKLGFERLKYTITSKVDEYTAIRPAEPQTVVSEDCGGDYDIFIRQEYTRDYVIKDITLNNSSLKDIPSDQIVWTVSKDKCDTGPILGDSILSVTGERKTYTIEIIAGPGGSASPLGSITVPSGEDSPEIVFIPDDGYALSRVQVNGRPSYDYDPLIIHEVRRDYRVEAQFRPTHVTITPAGDTTHGNYTPTEPYQIEYGGCTEYHELFPNVGYWGRLEFDRTDKGKSDFEAEAATPRYEVRICSVTQNMTALASFFPYTYSITAEAHGNGKIEPSGNMTAEYMSSITFILTADPGSSLIKITDNGVDVTDKITIRAEDAEDDDFVDERSREKRSRYVLSNITEDHDIEAFFTGASDYFVITPYSNEGGTIEPSKPQIVKRGEDISFIVTADSCHTIGSIVIEDKEDPFSSKGEDSLSAERGPHPSPKTVTLKNIQNSKDMTVEFVPLGYHIAVTQAEGGTIKPEGSVQVMCGADATFTITANPGNTVHKVIVNGIEEPGSGAEMVYTFPKVNRDHTLSAVFIVPPEPDFSAGLCEGPSNRPVNFENPVNLCRAPPKYPVTFKDLTKNSPTGWYWDFGDGTISTEREPTHHYADTGTYTVTLRVFNAASPPPEGVVKTMVDFITITTDPIAKFTVDPDIGMTPPGFTVKMTDLSLNAAATDRVTFAWDFGDGKGSSIGRNPSYTYDAPGVYRIGLKVEKPYVTADYYYHTITVLQEPVADFSAHPISGPAPLSVQFEDKSQGFPTQWAWDFGDGRGESQRGSYDVNPRYVYANPGVYAVTLLVISDEGSDMKTIEKFITVS